MERVEKSERARLARRLNKSDADQHLASINLMMAMIMMIIAVALVASPADQWKTNERKLEYYERANCQYTC